LSLGGEPEEFFESDDQVVVSSSQRARPKGSSAEITIKIADVWPLGMKGLLRKLPPTRNKALQVAGLLE